MRAILFGALVVALCACKKDDPDPEQFSVQIGVSCWNCKVSWNAGSQTVWMDTISGEIQGGDTIMGTAQWNVVIEEGQHIQVSARSVLITDFTPTTVTLSGDISTMTATAVSPEWAELTYTAPPH